MAEIARYQLNEGGGMTAADSVGSADGTLVGSPEWRSGGANPRGSYLRFGTGTQVDLPPIITVGPGISCSVTAWLRRQSGSVGEEAAFASGIAAGDFMICLGTGEWLVDTFSIDIGNAYSTLQQCAASAQYETGRWYHLAAVFRPTTVSVVNCEDNGSGLILVTAFGHGLTSGRAVKISGVTGTDEANGLFSVTVVDGQSFTLDGSTFLNGYTGGGVVLYGEVELFVDAVSQGVEPYELSVLGSANNDKEWAIGSKKDFQVNDMFTYQWKGDVDLAAIWDESLSQSQIDTLFGAGVTGDGTASSSDALLLAGD